MIYTVWQMSYRTLIPVSFFFGGKAWLASHFLMFYGIMAQQRFMMKKFRLSFIHYVLIGFISFAILAIFLRIFGKGYVTLIAIFLVLAALIALFEYQLQISELD